VFFCIYLCSIIQIKMPLKATIKTDGTTEEKIKAAARKLFTQRGFSATKTRDIANEAGINLALLNYYFRSKEKLFEIIMLENIAHFFQGVLLIVNDEKTGFYEKIGLLVDFYISRLMDNPDVPLFVLNEARNNPQNLPIQFDIMNSYFMKQFTEETKKGKNKKINTNHLMINILGLTIFPFAARPMMKKIRNIDDAEFHELMLERKKLVPEWIKLMLEAKIMMLLKNIFLAIALFANTFVFAQTQQKFTISGTIKDSASGEQLIGVIVEVKELPGTGEATNQYGFYSLTLKEGTYTLHI
jgi:AcrR family transcriptional regulator